MVCGVVKDERMVRVRPEMRVKGIQGGFGERSLAKDDRLHVGLGDDVPGLSTLAHIVPFGIVAMACGSWSATFDSLPSSSEPCPSPVYFSASVWESAALDTFPRLLMVRAVSFIQALASASFLNARVMARTDLILGEKVVR